MEVIRKKREMERMGVESRLSWPASSARLRCKMPITEPVGTVRAPWEAQTQFSVNLTYCRL